MSGCCYCGACVCGTTHEEDRLLTIEAQKAGFVADYDLFGYLKSLLLLWLELKQARGVLHEVGPRYEDLANLDDDVVGQEYDDAMDRVHPTLRAIEAWPKELDPPDKSDDCGTR